MYAVRQYLKYRRTSKENGFTYNFNRNGSVPHTIISIIGKYDLEVKARLGYNACTVSCQKSLLLILMHKDFPYNSIDSWSLKTREIQLYHSLWTCLTKLCRHNEHILTKRSAQNTKSFLVVDLQAMQIIYSVHVTNHVLTGLLEQSAVLLSGRCSLTV